MQCCCRTRTQPIWGRCPTWLAAAAWLPPCMPPPLCTRWGRWPCTTNTSRSRWGLTTRWQVGTGAQGQDGWAAGTSDCHRDTRCTAAGQGSRLRTERQAGDGAAALLRSTGLPAGVVAKPSAALPVPSPACAARRPPPPPQPPPHPCTHTHTPHAHTASHPTQHPACPTHPPPGRPRATLMCSTWMMWTQLLPASRRCATSKTWPSGAPGRGCQGRRVRVWQSLGRPGRSAVVCARASRCASGSLLCHFRKHHPLCTARNHRTCPLACSGKGAGIMVTPFAAGHLLGGAVWRIRRNGEDYVYAVDCNHRWAVRTVHNELCTRLLFFLFIQSIMSAPREASFCAWNRDCRSAFSQPLAALGRPVHCPCPPASTMHPHPPTLCLRAAARSVI